MLVTVARFNPTSFDTPGRLFIDGRPECYTLEDAICDAKIAGESCIPPGKYRLGLRHSPKFSPRYGHEMLCLHDVPGFEFILIHCGNTRNDTAGCILVGKDLAAAPGKETLLTGSRAAYHRVYPIIAAAIREGPVDILILNPEEGKGATK